MIHEFATSSEAFGHARRYARYGRRNWIVWRLADGRYKAAKIGPEAVEAAIQEAVGSATKPGYFSMLGKNDGCGMNVSPWLAKVWLDNMRAGTFAY